MEIELKLNIIKLGVIAACRVLEELYVVVNGKELKEVEPFCYLAVMQYKIV